LLDFLDASPDMAKIVKLAKRFGAQSPAGVTIKTKGKFTVGVLDRPITNKSIREAS
jgi:hypothetical protein